jgi:outer membrane receptor for ferrienterochelin and colicins
MSVLGYHKEWIFQKFNIGAAPMQPICRILLIFFWITTFSTRDYAQKKPSTQELSLDSLLSIKISTAAKYSQTLSEAPASVTIITSDDIKRYGYRTLEEVLTTITGFYTSYDRNYSYLGVRGFSRPTDYNNRILLLINGHTTNDNFYGSAAINPDLGINMNTINRIEIVRGPGSALYGTGAMFAVINIITKKGNDIEGIKTSFEHGDFGRNQAAVVIGTEFKNGVDVSFSGLIGDIKGHDLYYKEYDKPLVSDGISENLDWEKYYAVHSTLSYSNFALFGRITSRKKGIPTGAFEETFNDSRAMTLDEYSSVELKYENDIGIDKNISIRGYYDRYYYTGNYPAQTFTQDATNGKGIGGELRFRYDFTSNNRFIAGVEYRNNFHSTYQYWSRDTVFYDADFPYSIFSLYLQDEFQVTENLMVTLGARRDAYSTIANPITPRCALVYYPLKNSTMKLLYGEAFRAPNMYELHYFDLIGGQKVSSNLQSEKIQTAELIWEQRISDVLFGNVSFYRYDMKNLIDIIIDPSDSLLQYQNVSRVRTMGFEASLKAQLEMGLMGYANYSFQNAVNSDTKEKLTNSTSNLLKLGFSYPVVRYIDATVEFQYETKCITVYNTTTDPFFLTNLILSIHPNYDQMRLTILARNVFNVSYATPGGYEHRQPSIPQDVRNYTVKLEINF